MFQAPRFAVHYKHNISMCSLFMYKTENSGKLGTRTEPANVTRSTDGLKNIDTTCTLLATIATLKSELQMMQS